MARLVVLFSADFLGGSELFNLEFLDAVRAWDGIEVHAVVPGDGPLNAALKPRVASVRTVALPSALTTLSRFDARPGTRGALTRVSHLRRYVGALRATVDRLGGAVCCFGFRSQLAYTLAGAALGRRTAWVVHEVVPETVYGRLWGLAATRPETVLTYSRAAAGQPLLRNASVRVATVRFALERFRAVPAPAAVRTVGMIGDLVELKNHLAFIDVVELLGGVQGVIVGRDLTRTLPATAPYVAEVRRRVAASGGRVRLTEAAPAEMPDRLAEIDVLLHLTSVPESFGRVAVEAMAAGRPVIAFDHGAVPEVVGEGGALVAPGDLTAVAAQIRELDLAAASVRARRAAERFEAGEQRDTLGDELARFALGAA